MKHLQAAGFSVETHNVQKLNAVEARRDVPVAVRSCHTATMGGYKVEGHVPVALIERLLREKPQAVAGIGVVGMPGGSPGMESSPPVAYEVLAWRPSGETFVYARVGPDAKVQR